MVDNDIIETRLGPAGIVVRDGREYCFFAAQHAFSGMEGRLFKSPKEAEKATLGHAGTNKHSPAALCVGVKRDGHLAF